MSFLQMNTEATAEHAARIGRTGEALASEWQAARAAVREAAGGIGGDALGQAFAAGYLAASHSFQDAADKILPRFANLSDGGRQSVQLVEADEAAAVAKLLALG